MLFPWEPWEKGRAGQQECGTVGTEARAELQLDLGETHALNSSTLPASPTPPSQNQISGGKRKKKLHKNHAKRLECRLRWGECSGNCSVCCYSSTVHKPPMDKHFSALKHWGMAKHFPSEEFKGLTNPTKNSNIIVFPTGILANLVKSLQSDFGINCILISSIDNVISVRN